MKGYEDNSRAKFYYLLSILASVHDSCFSLNTCDTIVVAETTGCKYICLFNRRILKTVITVSVEPTAVAVKVSPDETQNLSIC